MCERDSYQMLDATRTTESTSATAVVVDECKCQENFIDVNRFGFHPMEEEQQVDNNERYTIYDRQQVSSRQIASIESLAGGRQHVVYHQQEPEISRAYPIMNDTCPMTSTAAADDPLSHNNLTATAAPNDSSSSNGSCGMRTNPPPPHAAPQSSSSSSIGVNLRVTGQCSQGGRKYMEDYFSVAYQQSEKGDAKDLEYAFIGIYDGHGGAEAAIFAKEHLMLQIINQKLFWSDSDQDVLRAIREGYIATHYAMWNAQDKWPRTANGLPSTAGTTATVAFIRREKIYIGHVGDSGIVLGYQEENEDFWRSKPLTTDHKPESVTERNRITNAGGKVIVKSGVPRVVWNRPRNANHRGPIRRSTPVDEIPFLAVARSLGDLWSYNSEHNEFVVSPDPEVKVVKINPKTFRCLIFGTDGLWNVMSGQEAVDIVYEKESINLSMLAQRSGNQTEGMQWTNPSKSLVDKALKVWSTKKMRADNTSVVTVILYPPNKSCDTSPAAAVQQSPNIGLEYMEVNGEIPLYEDVQTYQEVAEKYMPPKEYRNFNYYDDEDDLDILRNLSRQQHYEAVPLKRMRCSTAADVLNWPHEETVGSCRSPYIAADSNDTRGYMNWFSERFGNSNFGNTTSCDMFDMPSFSRKHGVEGRVHEQYAAEEEDEISEEDEDDSEEDDDEETEPDNEDEEESEGDMANRSVGDNELIDYANWIPTNGEGMMEHDNGSDDANSGYNSFAESYNSLISGHISQEASTSSSSPSYQSISGSSMHEIMQEQQRYQQQCMSEEEGYSLTKLETRREQQRCKSAVQTFKIFQQQQHQQQHQHLIQQQLNSSSSSSDSNGTWNCEKVTTFTDAISKLYTNCNTQPPQTHKPLDMHSLLQQERDEEAQVALERLQLQRMPKNNTAATISVNYNIIPETSGHILTPSTEHDVEDEEDMLIEEYLEDELPTTSSNSNCCDETVQINEISSSSIVDNCNESIVGDEEERNEFVNGGISSSTTTAALHVVEKIEKIEILTHRVRCTTTSTRTSTRTPTPAPMPMSMPKKVTAKNVEIKVLPTTKTVKICCNIKDAVNQQQTKYSRPCTRRTTLNNVSQQNVLPPRSKAYPNIPNENQHLKRISHNSGNGGNKNNNNQSQPKSNTLTAKSTGKRQLRSNAGTTGSTSAEYSKRTLRTRNTLAKEMKAKPQVTSNMKRAPAITAQLLRTAGVTLLNGQTVRLVTPQQRLQQQQTNSVHCKNNHNNQLRGAANHNHHNISNNNSNGSSKKCMHSASHGKTPPSTLDDVRQQSIVNAINLRSRQIVNNQKPQQKCLINLGINVNVNVAHTTAAMATGTSPNLRRCVARQLRSNGSSNTTTTSSRGLSNKTGHVSTTSQPTSCFATFHRNSRHSVGSAHLGTTHHPSSYNNSSQYNNNQPRGVKRPASTTPINVAIAATTSPTPYAYCAAQVHQPRLFNTASSVLAATTMMVNSRTRAIQNSNKPQNNRTYCFHVTQNNAPSQQKFMPICSNSDKRATLRSGAMAKEMFNSTMTRSRVQKMKIKR